MFSEVDGPTSLRAKTIHALSFSLGDATEQTPAGPVQMRAGMAAVWTGRKGEVVVLIRYLAPARVRRFRWAGPLISIEMLDEAIDAAHGFAQEMGFLLDSSEFRDLDPATQEARLERWDRMRKVRKPKGGAAAEPEPEPEQADIPDDAGQPLGPPREAEPLGPGDTRSRTVLGRIGLVRRGPDGTLDPLGRLLTFF